ncbi:MAG: MBL fold metallo-hydrolase [Deltaproteobacteria bacterium]|nr:MBL fold metallo-hydrolase [Deltaproteobacteria bacterium]
MLTAFLVLLALSAALAVFAWLFLSQDKFGALPEGDRLRRIQASPNYRDGSFQNYVSTPQGLNEDSSFLGSMIEFLRPKPRLVPSRPLPSVDSDLGRLPEDSLVWFGHSAFMLKLSGRTFLIDPSLSEQASPFFFTTKAFPGTLVHAPADLPPVDYLLISHDHWDHLDYPTIMEIKSRTAKVVVPLGVGAHFEKWGFERDKILEGDWWESFELAEGVKITLVPSRHFSGRGLKWNQSLWTGFLIEAGGRRIFYSGDGGYLPQYADFAEKIGPLDLAVMECGQYDRRWKDIHMTPEETVGVAKILGATSVMLVHSGKFSIANHPWDDPFIRFKLAAEQASLRPVTPMIGQIVRFGEPDQTFDSWWTGID